MKYKEIVEKVLGPQEYEDGSSDEATAPANAAGAIAQLKALMPGLSAEERLDIMHAFDDIYCKECGGEQPKIGRRCQCWNDE